MDIVIQFAKLNKISAYMTVKYIYLKSFSRMCCIYNLVVKMLK